jgi:hypothetical protein
MKLKKSWFSDFFMKGCFNISLIVILFYGFCYNNFKIRSFASLEIYMLYGNLSSGNLAYF